MAQPFTASNTGRRLGRVCEIALALLCLAVIAAGQSTSAGPLGALLNPKQPATTAPVPSPAPVAQTPAAIPLPDVAARSEDLRRVLRSLSDQLPTPEQLETVKATLDERDKELDARLNEIEALLAGTPSTLEFREQENYWREKQAGTVNQRRQLLDWANAAQSAMQQVHAQLPAWQATLEANENTPGLGPTLDVIRQAVGEIQRLNTQAQTQLKAIVNLQVRAANQEQLALDTLDRLSQARERADRRLLERDSLPLWQFRPGRQMGDNRNLYLSPSSRLLATRAFVSQEKGTLTFLFVLLLLSLFGAYRIYRATRGMEATTDRRADVLRIIRHWPALGLIPPLLWSYLLAPMAPLPLIGLAILVSFIPILSLLPPLIHPRARGLLYGLAGVYALSAILAWIGFSPLYRRPVQFLIYASVLALFAYLLRPSRMVDAQERISVRKLFIIRAALGILGFSLLADLFGYVRLAQLLGVLCLYSTFIAISMVTGVRVFTLLLLEFVDTATAERLALVRYRRNAIVRWAPRLLAFSGFVTWFIATINLLGLSEWLRAKIAQTSDFRIAGGTSTVTLGGVLGLFLILAVGYSISSAIRFLLREELLSRFQLTRGLPELIASTLHYLLLLLVFLFAMNAGGVELNRLTVLTGALGVGVGFGLQNIVNNFISGLILQFERPIHIGDVLDIDGVNGTVTRIGIRASTVKTFQGAELIIPNANFISNKVTNWTLTNPQRRLDLPVGVAYGSDVKLVAKLLADAANKHESVLTLPAPAVYFKQFGDSALNFELQFWVMEQSSTVRVKSEVALMVIAALDEAGIEIPFPQRDLRLRSVNPDAANTLLRPTGSEASLSDSRNEPEPGLLFDRVKGRGVGE